MQKHCRSTHTSKKDLLVPKDILAQWAEDILRFYAYRKKDAAFIADTLVEANCRGIDSHGIMRLPIYVQRITAKLLNPKAVPHITQNGAVFTVDAQHGSGHIATREAVHVLAKEAKKVGTSCATIKCSTHFGAAGYYARLLAEKGCIALVMSNAEPCVVPYGGKKSGIGTNPIALAAPCDNDSLSIDMASSTSSMGKVMSAIEAQQSISFDWGLDAKGNATDNPSHVAHLLPLGGAKGYALALIIEILSGVLSSANISHEIGNMYSHFDRPQNVGHFIWCGNVSAFMPLKMFKTRIVQLIHMMKSTPPMTSRSKVRFPGELEITTKKLRSLHGIPIPKKTLQELITLGAQCNIPFPSDIS